MVVSGLVWARLGEAEVPSGDESLTRLDELVSSRWGVARGRLERASEAGVDTAALYCDHCGERSPREKEAVSECTVSERSLKTCLNSWAVPRERMAAMRVSTLARSRYAGGGVKGADCGMSKISPKICRSVGEAHTVKMASGRCFRRWDAAVDRLWIHSFHHFLSSGASSWRSFP